MFKDKNFDSSAENIWKLLGTFFDLLPDASKQRLEAYYESLNYVNQGLFYKLSQNERMQFFKVSDGFCEKLFQPITAIFEDGEEFGRENTTKVFLKPPSNIAISSAAGAEVLAYRVSAVNDSGESLASQEVVKTSAAFPATVSWDSVGGATSYKVYGRSLKDHQLLYEGADLSFIDSNGAFVNTDTPKKTPTALTGYTYKIDLEDVILDVPSIVDQNKSTLIKQTDYEVRSNNSIFFPKDVISNFGLTEVISINQSGDSLELLNGVANSIITVNPLISNFYWKAFGDSGGKALRNWTYKPFLNNWDGQNVEQYATHIKYFSWAYSEALRKAPTINNIKHAYSLILGYPFAYQSGTVSSVVGTVITIGEYAYDVAPGSPNVTVGSEVSQFDILTDGVVVEDWYSNSALIASLVGDSLEQRLALHLDSSLTFSHNNTMVEFFKKTFLPAGLHLV